MEIQIKPVSPAFGIWFWNSQVSKPAFEPFWNSHVQLK
jgi:hypothetical protein